MDEQTKAMNKSVETYLRHYVRGRQQAWAKWLHVGEYCYISTHHTSIAMSSFRALYHYDPPNFTDLIFVDNRAPKAKAFLQESQDIMATLKENLQMAQNQQKRYYDKDRTKRLFKVGDVVYLRLQPDRQSSFKKIRMEKQQPRFFGPFKILRRVGEIAYELELPLESKIHNTFHVSLLKKVVGQQDVSSTTLPPLDDEGRLILTLKRIMETCTKNLRSTQLQELLVKWTNLLEEYSTWEGAEILSHPALNLLKGKQFEGEAL